jgi:hypothetical protein
MEPDWVREEREAKRRARLPILIVLGILALVFIPPAILGVGALGFLGFTLIRSALTHRQEGWITGLLFGVLLLWSD